MIKISVSGCVKSQYHQLWAEYSIRTNETPYNVSMTGYLTSIGNLRCCKWPISEIVGPAGVKMSQYGQNWGLGVCKIAISPIMSRIFD